ncbi:MAG: asparagine synthase C-terminal domain-containing protein [Comamonadaceae bacterium]|nr:asparagine synthase C-terminal domain-containing protein [Comamonadaceae bacterium]
MGFPFLERGAASTSRCALPTDYKLKGLKLRWFFKEALRGFLPDEIITKKKQGFGLPFGVWATRHAGLQSLRHRLAAVAGRPRHRPAATSSRRCWPTQLPAHPGYYGEMVWILMMLEQWLQGRPAGGVALKAFAGHRGDGVRS